MTAVAEYRGSKDLFINLTLRELRSKYKRSFLGWAWSMINPLTYMIIYTVLFRFFLKVKITPGRPSGLSVWALFLLAALLPWNFFQTAVTASIGSLTGGSNLIKKSYFPRALLPASAVASALVSHLIEMGLLLIAVVCFGNFRALYYLPVLAVLIFLVAVFALGLGLMFSALNVYFRDIEHFMMIAFLVWLYLTPVVYPITITHGMVTTLLKLNPMTDATLSFRNILYDGSMPGLVGFAGFAVAAGISLMLGLAVFNRLEPRFAEEL